MAGLPVWMPDGGVVVGEAKILPKGEILIELNSLDASMKLAQMLEEGNLLSMSFTYRPAIPKLIE